MPRVSKKIISTMTKSMKELFTNAVKEPGKMFKDAKAITEKIADPTSSESVLGRVVSATAHDAKALYKNTSTKTDDLAISVERTIGADEFKSSILGKADPDRSLIDNLNSKVSLDTVGIEDANIKAKDLFDSGVLKLTDKELTKKGQLASDKIYNIIKAPYKLNDMDIEDNIAEKISRITGTKMSRNDLIKNGDGDFISNVNKVLKNHYEHQQYDMSITERSVELATYTGIKNVNDSLKRIPKVKKALAKHGNLGIENYSMANLSIEAKRDLNKVLESEVLGVRNVMFSGLKNDINITTWKKHAGTIEDQIGALYEMSKTNGMEQTANHLHRAYEHLDSSHGFVNKMYDLGVDVRNKFKGFDEKEAPIRAYRERAYKKVEGQKYDLDESNSMQFLNKETGINETIRVDKQALAEVNKLYPGVELQLGGDELKFANAMTNIQADMLIRKIQEAEGKIVKHELVGGVSEALLKKSNPNDVYNWGRNISPNHFSDNLAAGKYVDFVDAGRNYSPIVANENFKSQIKSSNNIELREAKNYLNKKQLDDGQHSLRKLTDGVANLDENRLGAGEEFLHYANRYKKSMVKDKMDMIMKETRQSMDLESTIVKPHLSGQKNNLEFLNKKMDESFKHVEEHIDNAFKRTREAKSEIMKIVYDLTDIGSSTLLASPTMISFNLLQPLTNSANFKGFWNTVSSMTKTTKPMLKHMLGGKGPASFEEVIKSMKDNTMTRRQGENLHSYMNKYLPKAVQPDLYNDGELMKRYRDFITLPFKMSDLHTRGVVIGSATAQAEKAITEELYNTYINASKKSPEAFKKMAKALHLEEFNSMEKMSIMKASRVSRDRFIEEFSHKSVNREIYNYGILNRPDILDKLKGDPFTSRASRFLSWNMYYIPLVEGAFNAFQNGDTKPLAKLVALSTAWYVGASYVAGEEDLGGILNHLGEYGVGRTPAVAPIMGLANLVNRPLGGILGPTTNTATFVASYGLDKVNDLVGSNGDAFDYQVQDNMRMMKNLPEYSKLKGMYDMFND